MADESPAAALRHAAHILRTHDYRTSAFHIERTVDSGPRWSGSVAAVVGLPLAGVLESFVDEAVRVAALTASHSVATWPAGFSDAVELARAIVESPQGSPEGARDVRG